MSVVGRFFAIIVILSGLIIFGLVTSVMTTAITTATMETESSLYGAKVQANTTCLSACPTLENYTKVIRGFSFLRSVIGPEASHHPLNQSEVKLKPMVPYSPQFSCTQGCWHKLTLSPLVFLTFIPDGRCDNFTRDSLRGDCLESAQTSTMISACSIKKCPFALKTPWRLKRLSEKLDYEKGVRLLIMVKCNSNPVTVMSSHFITFNINLVFLFVWRCRLSM